MSLGILTCNFLTVFAPLAYKNSTLNLAAINDLLQKDIGDVHNQRRNYYYLGN